MATSNQLIPVIDISGPNREAEIARQLVDAASSYGFIYLKNEGREIPVAAIDAMFAWSKEFFASPVEEKTRCTITENNRGWSGMHTETLDAKHQRVRNPIHAPLRKAMLNSKRAFNIGGFKDGKAQQPLPPSLIDHEGDLDRFYTLCHELMLKILRLFSIGLQIDEEAGGANWMPSRHQGGPSDSILRLLYYPSIPSTSDYQPSLDIRAGAHSDYGSITLLFQRPGQPGLEIISPSHDVSHTPPWTPVPVFPPTTESDPSPPILVNIGDLLSHWTHGLLKSTVHRVVFPKDARVGGEDRYSMAYFGHPVSTTVLEAIPSETVRKRGKGGESGVKAMTAHEHLMTRLKATYLGMYQDEKEQKEEDVIAV